MLCAPTVFEDTQPACRPHGRVGTRIDARLEGYRDLYHTFFHFASQPRCPVHRAPRHRFCTRRAAKVAALCVNGRPQATERDSSAFAWAVRNGLARKFLDECSESRFVSSQASRHRLVYEFNPLELKNLLTVDNSSGPCED